MDDTFPATSRSAVKLFGNRGSHRKESVYFAIDAALYGTVAYMIDGQPFATPTMIWRQGDHLYWHGSAGSRMLKTVAAGAAISVTFVHVDGFVLSRLASAHAMNYRSVMAFGHAEPVDDIDERRRQLEFFLTRLFPGRWDEVKQPSLAELNSIIMVRLRIDEASLKMRAGPPADGRPVFGGDTLFEQACWAGVLPIATAVGQGEDANRLKDTVARPAYLDDFAARFGAVARIDPDVGRPIEAVVAAVRQVAAAVRLFRLEPAGEDHFPAVSAGAHLKIGVVRQDGTRDYREYTIVNADAGGAWYEIAVLRDAKGRGGSLYLHENASPGTRVRLMRPENHFALSREAAHSILIAGGIGITPILAMARELSISGRSVDVHYSARGRDQAAFLDELEDLAAVSVQFYDTSVGPDGRMDLDAILGSAPPGTHVYVCGPHALNERVAEVAAHHAFAPGAVHREAFSAPAPKSDDKPVQVTLGRSGVAVTVRPGESILDAVLAKGAEVGHSCKRGECGLCAIEVTAGTPDHRDTFLTERQRTAEGKMCICVSWAKTAALTLDV